MPFIATWYELITQIEKLSEGTTMITPLSQRCFRIANTHEQRVIISLEDDDRFHPLQREQFAPLYDRIHDDPGAFELDRLSPNAAPYPTVLSVHPRHEIDADAGTITQTETKTVPSLLDPAPEPAPGDKERSEPELALYPGLLLLVDALERADPDALDQLETAELINLYTLLSDIQRGANDQPVVLLWLLPLCSSPAETSQRSRGTKFRHGRSPAIGDSRSRRALVREIRVH